MRKPFYIVEKKHGNERRFVRSKNCRGEYRTNVAAERDIKKCGGADVTYRIVRLNAVEPLRTIIKS